MMTDTNTQGAKKGPILVKILILLVLVGVLVAFLALGGADYLRFDALRENRQWLLDQVETNALLTALVFVGLYTLIVAFSLPGGALMTLTGGFLFGTLWGGLYTVIAATIGATGLFLAARYVIGDALRKKAGARVQRMEEGFRAGEVSYMLVLRLVPLFPFFIVNLAPALLGVRLITYVWTTFVGIMPGTFVFASVGNGLGVVFDQGGMPDLGILFSPEILPPLLGLAALAMVPVIYKRLKARNPTA